MEALEDRKLLTTFTVLNTLDDGSAGSLRWAVDRANLTAGADTIDFDSIVFSTPQTITLSGTQLELSDTDGTTTIAGPAGGVTVDGGGLSRVFQVDALVTASISGLTITGGNSGYGYPGYGYGGGLANYGTATLTNCTVSGNSAGFGGGGVSTGSYYNQGAATTLTNCTVSGNSNGGLDTYFGTTTAINTIIAGNVYLDLSGSLAPGSTNNLIGGNPLLARLGYYGGTGQTMALLPGSPAVDAGTSAGAPATDERGLPRVGAVDIGAFESQGFNFALVPGSTPQTSDIGTAFANPLAVSVTANNPVEPVNGGVFQFVANPAANGATAIFLDPTDPSAVITNGQAALTAAPNNILGTYTVVASAGALSTAFDLTNTGTPFAALIVNTTSDALAPGAGLLSLREAIGFNNTAPAGNSPITFDSTVFNTAQSITLTGSQLELTNTIGTATITGPAAG